METPTLKGGKDERPQTQRGGRVKDETGPTSTPPGYSEGLDRLVQLYWEFRRDGQTRPDTEQ